MTVYLGQFDHSQTTTIVKDTLAKPAFKYASPSRSQSEADVQRLMQAPEATHWSDAAKEYRAENPGPAQDKPWSIFL